MALPVTYGTVENVYRNQPEISSVSTITSATIAYFLGKAEALVNAKIVNRYSLPLASTPPILETITSDVATYYIIVQRLFTAKRAADSPWPDRYKEALETLNEIAKGEIPLVSSAGTLIDNRTDVAEVWSNTMDYVPTFDELDAWDQFPDEDKLNDLRDDKGLFRTS